MKKINGQSRIDNPETQATLAQGAEE